MAGVAVTSLLAIIVMTSRLNDAQVVTPQLAVATNSCLCTVTINGSKPCEFEEITRDHYKFDHSSEYPLEVKNLDLTTIEQMDTKTVNLQVTWEPPEGAAIRWTTGFVLHLVKGTGMQILYISLPTTPGIKPQNQVKWTLRCALKREIFGSDLLLKVFPTPLPLPKTVKWKYVEKFITIPTSKSITEENVLEWTPSITFNPQEDKPRFSLSFTVPMRFQRKLIAFKISFTPTFDLVVKVPIENGSFSFTSQEVKSLNQCYNITLRKVLKCEGCDSWACNHGDSGCTVATEIQVSNKLWNGSSCAVPPQPLFVPAVPVGTTERTPNPDVVKTGSDEESNALVAVGVIVPLTTLLAMVVIAIAFRRKHSCTPDPGPPSKKPKPDKKEVSVKPEEMECSIEALDTKRILIIYSDDHPWHKEVIKKFATFLQAWCKCTVHLDEWSMTEMSKDIVGWYLYQLEKADKVIFVQSEGVYHKYRAYTMKEEIPYDATPPPKGDPFLMLLPTVVKRIVDGKGSFVMTHFPYTDTSFLTNSIVHGFMYNLPEHFQDMVLHIHDASTYNYRTKTRIESVNSDDYHQTLEGSDLKKAIENAEKFTKNSPDWFKKRYQRSDGDGGIQKTSRHTGNGVDSGCNMDSFVSEVRLDELSLKPPDSDNNSVDDIPHLIEPEALSVTESDAPDDLRETSLCFDSGVDTMQGTREEVLGGIVNGGSPDTYGDAQGGNGDPPISFGDLSDPHENLTGDQGSSVANYEISIGDDGDSMGGLGNTVDDHRNAVCIYGNSMDGYGNSMPYYGNSMDGHGNAVGDPEHSVGNYGNVAGIHGYSLSEYGNVPWLDMTNKLGSYGNQSDCENPIVENGNRPGDFGNSIGDHNITSSHDVHTAIEYAHELGGYRDAPSTSLDSSEDGPYQDDLLPPESISSCTSSFIDLEMQVESQAEQNYQGFHFTLTDGTPDTNTDHLVRNSV